MLDTDEYLHLAIHASSKGEHHACMSYLKELLQQQPAHAAALYLLAAQHAELGLLDRAIRGMKAALLIQPDMEIAQFQLGLLLLDKGLAAEAKPHFSALGSGANPALRLFSDAMVALADADSVTARKKLSQGLAAKSANPALSGLMQRFFDHLSKNAEAVPSESSASPANQHLSLGAYGQARD